MTQLRRTSLGALRSIVTLLGLALLVTSCSPSSSPSSAGDGRGPYLGWSSWSLQALVDGRSPAEKQTAAWAITMSDAMSEKLGAHGYRSINIDDYWWSSYDELGRQVPDAVRFPDGIAGVAEHVHAHGQTLGVYLAAGLPTEVYDADTAIEGTTCTSREIALQPLTRTNGWLKSWAIDWTHPCAQAYVDSIAALYASWGVDFVKLDGVTPNTGPAFLGGQPAKGSPADNRGDVEAWHRAIEKSGRRMWLTLSWWLDPHYASTWAANANAVRITPDVECYCETLTHWEAIWGRFLWAPLWTGITDATGLLPDFDSLDVGVGAMDGLSDVQRKTAATLWAVGGAPFYVGDDLTRLDTFGLALLTNERVLDIVRSGRPLRPLASGALDAGAEMVLTGRQVWTRTDRDGSALVALFNTGPTERTVSVALEQVGIASAARVVDVWSGEALGTATGTYAVRLETQDSQLVRLVPIR